jgi:hypothetical protein
MSDPFFQTGLQHSEKITPTASFLEFGGEFDGFTAACPPGKMAAIPSCMRT